MVCVCVCVPISAPEALQIGIVAEMEVPERGVVFLRHRDGVWQLYHAITKEIVFVSCEKAAAPMLTFDDAGCGMLVVGGETTWTANSFSTQLISQEGVGMVLLKGSDAITLQEASSRHREIQVPFDHAGFFALSTAFVFEMLQVHGLRVWWGLHSLWSIFGVAGNACAWIANRSRWWLKKWLKRGLPVPHFRPSLKSQSEVGSSVCGIDLGVDHRAIAECSLSTAALLAFLVQSASPRAKTHEEQASQWRRALRCVACVLLPGCELHLVFDKRYDPSCFEWAPETTRSVRVPLRGGRL